MVDSVRDLAPIVAVVAFFQLVVLQQTTANLGGIVVGLLFDLIGLTFFLVSLEQDLFPLGKLMVKQLTDLVFIHGASAAGSIVENVRRHDFFWVYLFAAAIKAD